MKSFVFLALFLILCINYGSYSTPVNSIIPWDPDMYLNLTQLITSKGFPVLQYDVVTKDGYIITIFRIPSGHSRKQNNYALPSKSKEVVFLQHGLLACCADWVDNQVNQSLGFILADSGYDVWLGNVRGNTYGLRHVNYSTSSSEFWNFSFDEMAMYDLPAMIDFVLKKTNQDQLYYIGHSQGSTMAFAMLSEMPNYNTKIRAFFAYGPVTTVGYAPSPIRYLAPFSTEIEIFFYLFGVKEFAPHTFLLKYFSELVCETPLRKYCENIIFLLSGIDEPQLNLTRVPVYTAHDPAGTSTKNLLHWAQLINSKKFQKYDYGRSKNIEKYGQDVAPEYKIENIKTPVALFWGENDWLADPVDVSLLVPRIQNLIISYRVKFPLWSHLDFVWGIDAPDFVYNETLYIISKLSK